jgi:hypothetical protein
MDGGDVMGKSRQEMQGSIAGLYSVLGIFVNMLNKQVLDPARADIKTDIERLLAIVNHNAEYKEVVGKLDNEGLAEYERKLSDLLHKIEYYKRDFAPVQRGIGSLDEWLSPYQPAFRAAGPVHHEPELEPATDTTGKGFIIKKYPSSQFEDNFTIAINYLSKSYMADKIINYVKNNALIFVEFIPAESEYRHEYSTIYWNDKGGIMLENGGIISSARVLMHEITHAYVQTQEGSEAFAYWKRRLKELYPQGFPFNINYEEEFVTLFEILIGDQLGEKAQRRHYDDLPRGAHGWLITTTVPSPTFYKDPYLAY